MVGQNRVHPRLFIRALMGRAKNVGGLSRERRRKVFKYNIMCVVPQGPSESALLDITGRRPQALRQQQLVRFLGLFV